MLKCTIVQTASFYQPTEQIIINAPEAGIVLSDHPDITIVPKIVQAGENKVIAIRNTRLVTVEAGTVVGIVLPLDSEDEPEEIQLDPELFIQVEVPPEQPELPQPGTIIEVPTESEIVNSVPGNEALQMQAQEVPQEVPQDEKKTRQARRSQ